MAVTAERFSQGMTYDEYKAQMTRNQERFVSSEAAAEIDADSAAVIKAAGPVKVLVLAEDWCGDVIDNLPVLGKLAQQTGNLDIRVFLRDQNDDIMSQYLNNGQFKSIPVFVFFDNDMNEKGVFIERPQSASDRRAAWRSQWFADNPDAGSPDTPITQLSEEVRTKMMTSMSSARDTWKPDDNRDVVNAIRAIVAG